MEGQQREKGKSDRLAGWMVPARWKCCWRWGATGSEQQGSREWNNANVKGMTRDRVAAVWWRTRSLEERRPRGWKSAWILNSPRTVAGVVFDRVMMSQELNLRSERERL